MSPFNKARYRALLEGLEAAEVRFSELNDETRYESQYYLKQYLRESSAVDRHDPMPMGSMAYVTDGPHGYHEVDDESEVHMLTARCAKDWRATTKGADRISAATHEANLRSSLEEGDLILSTRGTVGLCALVEKEVLPVNIDQDVARIHLTRKRKSFARFLCAYLNSQFGQDHIERVASGMVQQGISLQKVREIPVPNLSSGFVDAVSNIVASAFKRGEEADASLRQAERSLLSSLGLEDWNPPNPHTYEKQLGGVVAAARWDSKFFQPKFDEVRTRISQKGICCSLGEVVESIARSRQPCYTEKGYPVINSKHVLEGEIVKDGHNRLAEPQPNSICLRCGDVLMNGTGVGTMGRSATYLDGDPAFPDNHVTVIRVDEDEIDPVFLSTLLNSCIGKMQVEQFYKGSSGQIELYPEDIAKFQIWMAPRPIQKEIRTAVEEARVAKARSKSLLERAKRAVEIAIEQDEATAMAYLDGKHYVAEELLPKLFGPGRHYVDLETIQCTIEAEAIHYEATTVRRYLHHWEREARLHDAGRGWYSDLPHAFDHAEGVTAIDKVRNLLAEDFPFLDHTIWSTKELTAWFHHLPTRHATFLMIDRDAFEPVADALRDAGHRVVVHPLGEMAKKFSLEGEDTVILRPRLSSDQAGTRSPIEHTLVDLLHETRKLGILEEAEFRHVVRNLATSRRLHIPALKRYATRRKIDPADILEVFL